MNRFKIGDRVSWASKGKGQRLKKIGVVRYVIPEGVSVKRTFGESRHNRLRFDPKEGLRDHESYVVEVERLGRLPLLYHPRVQHLKPAK